MLLVSLTFIFLCVSSLQWACKADALFGSDVTTESVKVSQLTPRNLPSDAWKPVILTTCFDGLHPESGPCRRIPNLVYAEELLYQDFRIRLPRFVHEDHKRIYLKVLHHYRRTWLRSRIIDDHGYFLNQRGQNLIYENVTYDGRPYPGIWTGDACMAYGADQHVTAFPPWHGNNDTAPAAVFVASPDDYSFQHFLDRVAVMLAQTRHLTTTVGGGWKYISSQIPQLPSVQQLWKALIPGFSSSSLLPSTSRSYLDTRLLLYPCQAPLIHPYHHQLASELIQQAAGFDPRVTEPIASRPVVLFLARSGSRNWVNQEECRRGIEQLVSERGRGEEVLVFKAEAYPTVKDVVALGRRIKLMVGVHGGSFYNLVFMQPGTGLVEVCPVAADERSSRCGAMFWEMGSVRNMHYWSVVATNTTSDWQIRSLDCGLVVRAVQDALENLERLPSPLESFHQGSKFRRRERRR